MNKKNIWVIDGAYLYKSTPGRFDYLLLKRELQLHLGITFGESYYFNSRVHAPTPAQMSFNKWLQTADPSGPQLIVKLMETKRIVTTCNECGRPSERYIQKGVDVAIVTQVFKLLQRQHLQRLTFCAGDSDFNSALEAVNDHGIPIDIVGFKDTMASDLQQWGNVVWLDNIWPKIEKQPRPHQAGSDRFDRNDDNNNGGHAYGDQTGDY